MDKIRVLCFTDTHYTAKSPVSRKDGQEYLNHLLNKTKEIWEIGKDKKVDFFIHGGDFFESPNVSDSVAGQVGKIYMQAPAPVYIVPGNHDLVGNSYTTLMGTKLGLMINLEHLKLIDSYNPLIYTNKKTGKTLKVTASQSDFGIDKNREAFISTEKDSDFLMHVIHAMLLRNSASLGSYVPLNDIVDLTKADVTFSGHYHLGFETLIYDSKLSGQRKIFSNPGALARKSALLEEVNREVKVHLYTFDCSTMEINIEEIPLKSALPSEEVLDRDMLEEEKIYQEKITNFKLSLLDKDFTLHVDPIELINSFLKEKDIPTEVKDEVIKRITLAKDTEKVEE